MKELIDQYRAFHPEQGVEQLLRLRQKLSCALYDLGMKITDLEDRSKTKDKAVKISMAIKELDEDGTQMERKNKAVISTRSDAMEAARLEGELKGYRIQFESVKEILNSMSSYLQKM
jgi:hypothetical protein